MKLLYILLSCFFVSQFSIAQSKIETFVKSDSLVSMGQLDVAEKYLLKLSKENPYNGFNNYLLGINHHYKQRFELSNIELRKAQKFNWFYMSNYLLASNYIQLGQPDSAIYFLKEYIKTPFKGPEINSILTDTIFNKLHSLPEFKKLFPSITDLSLNANDGWLNDIEYLEDMLKKTHFQPYFKLDKTNWEKSITNLIHDIPKLTNNQILVRILQFIASMGDAHTRILSFHEYNKRQGTRKLPFDVQIFDEGFYIINTTEYYSFLLGARLVSVNNISIDSIFSLVSILIPNDNQMWCKRQFNSYFKDANLLSGLGISEDSKDSLKIEVEINSDIFNKNIAISKTTTRDKTIDYHSFYASKVPIYLKSKNLSYWYKYYKDEKILYFQLNSITSNKEIPLEQFCDSLRSLSNKTELNAFILDIRLNTGGSSRHNKTISKLILSDNINRRGKLFVVIGQSTFSAAQNLASDLEYYSDAIFIGEPTGSSPNFIGEINPITLPYSGLVVSSSNVYHQRGLYSSDERKWKAPDIYIPVSFNDFINGEDPVLSEIIKYVNR